MPEKPTGQETPNNATRRDLFHIANVLALPAFLGGGAPAMAATGPLRAGPEIYQSIGVEPVINCRGTFTIIGASIELPEVRAAKLLNDDPQRRRTAALCRADATPQVIVARE